MKSSLPLLLLLAACPTPEDDAKLDDTGVGDTAGYDSGTDDTELDTMIDTGDDEDADWGGGGCEYTVSAVGADEAVAYLGGTPAEFAALASGARGTTLHFDAAGVDTTLDHTLTIDPSTAQLWSGVWIESDSGWGEDTTDGGDDDTTPADEGGADEGSGGSDGGGGGSDGGGGEDTDKDSGESEDPTDTGVVYPDTGVWDEEDTGGGGPSCPDYLTAEATWSFATGDGAFAEAMRVTVRAHSLPIARIDHSVDLAALAGTFVPPVEDPAGWDELRVQFAASIGDTVDFGEVSVFGSRVWSSSDDTGDGSTETDVAEAFMSGVARWPAPDGDGG